jgi:hypothetical protein
LPIQKGLAQLEKHHLWLWELFFFMTMGTQKSSGL